MKIVIDTNIIFSAILNPNSRISEVLLNDNLNLEYYSSSFLRYELIKHQDKISKISKLSISEIEIIKNKVFSNIVFIDENDVPKVYRISAYEILRNIDLSDLPFLALSLFLNAKIWTGDKVLMKGLIKKEHNIVITTKELLLKTKKADPN